MNGPEYIDLELVSLGIEVSTNVRPEWIEPYRDIEVLHKVVLQPFFGPKKPISLYFVHSRGSHEHLV